MDDTQQRVNAVMQYERQHQRQRQSVGGHQRQRCRLDWGNLYKECVQYNIRVV